MIDREINELFGNLVVEKKNLKQDKIDELEKEKKDISHDHPACASAPKHKHEKAYVTSSAGGEITEGCVEHYFDRIVAEDEQPPSISSAVDLNKLGEYVVMGEILLNPRFKGGNRRI